jgi:hypothetical protein
MQQVTDWPEKLGLGQYAQRFAENDISFSVLPDLTDQDLLIARASRLVTQGDAGFAGGSVSWRLRATLKWRPSKGGGDDKAGAVNLHFGPFPGVDRCFDRRQGSDKQPGIWACTDRFRTCIDWCRVYTDPAPLISCLTECNRNLTACLRAVTKQFRAERPNLRER